MPKFISTYKDLTLVVKPGDRTYINHRLVIEKGRRIKFAHGEYRTEDPGEIKFIKEHRLFGNQIFEDDQKQYRVIEVKPQKVASKKSK